MSRDPLRAAIERQHAESTAEPLRFRRPLRIEAADAGMLRWSLVHPSHDGRVLLEAGAPMTDGSTAYLVWLSVREEDTEVSEVAGSDSRYYRHAYGGPLGFFEGRWYRHAYDEGGLASAKHSAALVAHEAT